MLEVKQSTARPFSIFFGSTGLTVTATLSKNGGAFASVSPTVNDRGNGYYTITPSTTHRDTLGENAWLFYDGVSEYLPRVEQVVTLDPFANEVDTVALGGDTQSATDLKDFADDGYDPATNKVQGVVLVDTTTTNSDMRGTDNAATAVALSTMQGNVTDILADTNELQSDDYPTTLAALATAANLATVASYLDTEIAAIQTAVVTSIPSTLAGLATAAALSTMQGNVTDILADTNELQMELADDGRLDVLIDGIKAKTDNTVQVGTSYNYANDGTGDNEDVTIT